MTGCRSRQKAGTLRPMLRLHRPRREELPIRQGWLADPDLMAYNAGWDVSFPGYDPATGCIDWPEPMWEGFVEAYLAADPARAGYWYLHLDGVPVGHAHYRIVGDIAHIGVMVVPGRRGQGLAGEALRLLLDRIWSTTPAVVVQNDFEDSRGAAVALHRRAGFTPGTLSDGPRPTRVWTLRRPAPAAPAALVADG